MSKSPGHQKWPEHKVLETPVREQVTVELDGQIVAESRTVIRVDEDGSRKLDDAVWAYEQPFDEHQTLKDRLAFYDDKYRNIHVRVR